MIVEVIKLAGLKPRIILIAALMVLAMLLPACSNQNKQAKKPSPTSQQMTKPPEEMKTILSGLEELLAGLEQKLKSEQASPLAQKSQTTGQSQQGQQQGKSQQGQQGQQQGKSQSSQSGGKQGQSQSGQSQGAQSQGGQSAQTSWQKEDTQIKNIHRDWNRLEPEAIKAGLTTAERDGLEQALEKLTLAVGRQNKDESLSAAIELYGHYPILAKVFKTAVPPEFYQLKYEVMATADQARKKEWTLAQEHIPKIQEAWTNLKVKIQKQDGKSISRTEFSVTDVEQAVETRQMDLLMIKAEIVFKNLQQVEKELTSQKTQTSSG